MVKRKMIGNHKSACNQKALLRFFFMATCGIRMKMIAQSEIYGIILGGATSVREAGQGRNPAALSDVGCVLFLYFF